MLKWADSNCVIPLSHMLRIMTPWRGRNQPPLQMILLRRSLLPILVLGWPFVKQNLIESPSHGLILTHLILLLEPHKPWNFLYSCSSKSHQSKYNKVRPTRNWNGTLLLFQIGICPFSLSTDHKSPSATTLTHPPPADDNLRWKVLILHLIGADNSSSSSSQCWLTD